MVRITFSTFTASLPFNKDIYMDISFLKIYVISF